MSMKKVLEEKERAAQRLIGEVIQQIDTIPDEAIDEVASYLRGKLEVYEKDLKASRNGNGTNGRNP